MARTESVPRLFATSRAEKLFALTSTGVVVPFSSNLVPLGVYVPTVKSPPTVMSSAAPPAAPWSVPAPVIDPVALRAKSFVSTAAPRLTVRSAMVVAVARVAGWFPALAMIALSPLFGG